jgi:hypothetical protein
MSLNPTEQGYFQVLRKQAADKEDLHSLNLLDIAEQLPEQERNVIASLVASRMKHEMISLIVCTAMATAARHAMQLTIDVGLVGKREA